MNPVNLQPQHLFKPQHLLMNIDAVANLLEISVQELKDSIQSGQSPQHKLVQLHGEIFVKYNERASSG